MSSLLDGIHCRPCLAKKRVKVVMYFSGNLSNEEKAWEEIMQIKAMPVPMHQKRELKARLQVRMLMVL